MSIVLRLALRLAPLVVAALAAGAGAQEPSPLAELESIGAGTPGAAGIPRLVSLGRPAVGEPGLGLRLEGGLPGAAALLIVGPGVDPTPLPRFGVRLVPQLPALRVPLGILDAQGDSATFHSGPAPASPALLGLEFAAQGLVADPGAQGGAAFTAGLRLRFGVGFAAPGLFAGLGYRAQESYASLDPVFATGDFDGNGRRDMLLLVVTGPERVRVFRQLIDGSFAPPVSSFAPPGHTNDFAVADVDGDTRLDLVLSHSSPDGARVYTLLGTGDGRFGPPTTLQGPPDGGASPIAVADVTADGALDLLAANWSSNMLGVLPAFAPAGDSFPMWGSARALRVGDVTGDGMPDAVALVWAPGYHLSVLRGLGGGDFALPALTATGVEEATCLELGDLDGDGDLDALVGHLPAPLATEPAPTLLVLANDGSGAFTPAGSVVTADFHGMPPHQLELADLERDGDLDLVVAHDLVSSFGLAPVTILENLGGGALDAPRALLPRLAIDAVDMDGDGVPDIAGNLPGFISAAAFSDRGLGDGRFDLPQHLPLPLWPAGAGDFDGDGDLDLAGRLAADDFPIAVSLWTTPAGFGAPVTYDAQGGIVDVDGLVVADVDPDGRPDVVAAGDDTVRVFRGDGAGGLLAPQIEPLHGAAVPRVADIDGDGRPDLVVSRWEEGLSVLLGLPGGGFAAAVTTPALSSTGFDRFEVGDLDGDGHLDVVAQGAGGFDVLRGTGDGHFASEFVAAGSGPAEELPLLLADFDRDGDLDLARLDFGGFVTIWSNDGRGVLIAGQAFLMSDFTFTLAAADLNLDGSLDLPGGDLRLGFGDGTFATPHPGIAAGALGDFDSDGDVDVFVNGYVFYNRAR